MQHLPPLDDPGKSIPLLYPLRHSLHSSSQSSPMQGTMKTEKTAEQCMKEVQKTAELPDRIPFNAPEAWLLLLPTLDGMLRMSKMRAVQSLLPVIMRLQFIGFTCTVFTCTWSNQSTQKGLACISVLFH